MFHYMKTPEENAATEFRFPEPQPHVSQGIYARYVKRFLDILIVLAAAPVVLPVLGIFALLIRRDGGAAFYSQERVGKDGQNFTCWKLRSMVVDADAKLADYLAKNPAANAEWTVSQKLRHDPRITKVGHFIRKTSIDELPQFWCILMGDMSLVGPRPFLLNQKKLYKGNAYYALRPGLTGFWQVGDRNETSFAARAVFNNHYSTKLTLKTNINILMHTINIILRNTNI